MRSALSVAILGATVLAPAPAQGYIRSPLGNTNTTAHLIHFDTVTNPSGNVYRLYFPGWTTVATPGPENGGGQGTGVDTPTNEIRNVSGAGLVEENTGGTLEEMKVFDFRREMNVVQGLTSSGTFAWTGFAAQPGIVPEFEPGALVFEMESGSPLHTLRSGLLGARAMVAEVDASGFRTNQNNWLMTATDVQPARVLYYKFERGEGDIAFNYGGFPGAPRIGDIVSNVSTAAWPTGAFGKGLRGGNLGSGQYTYCDTGWGGGLHGSFTVAWFMKQRSSFGAQTTHLFSGPNGLRCFTGGNAGSGLVCDGWDGTNNPLVLNFDVQSAAAGQWAHVALVVDVRASPSTATWYVNGIAQSATIIANGAAIDPDLLNTTFKIGTNTNATASSYDIDEFRLWAQAVPAVAISDWTQRRSAAATSLGRSCSANLRHRGGAPAAGNAQFGLTVEGLSNRPCALFLGLSQLPTPLDLGTVFAGLRGEGCLLYGGVTLSVPNATNANGLANYMIPLPTQLPAAVIYSQAVILGPGRLTVSNAHAAAIR